MRRGVFGARQDDWAVSKGSKHQLELMPELSPLAWCPLGIQPTK